MANKNKIINVAQKYLSKGQYDKAIKELQKVVEEDPRDVRTLLKIGDISSKKGDKATATRVYRQVAEFYSEQGFFLKAVAVYKQVLKYDPDHLEVTLKLAELYEHLGLVQEATGQYQALAQIHEQASNQREALAVLGRMVDLDPDNVASRVRLAEGYSKENLAAEAVSQFERAAEILKRQSRVNDYIKVAERLVFHDPGRFELLKELAQLYLQRGDNKRALAKLHLCFKAQPRDIETLTLLASAFQLLGQSSKTVFVYKELAKIYQESNQHEAARQVFERILEVAPNDPEACAAMGVAPVDPDLMNPMPGTDSADLSGGFSQDFGLPNADIPGVPSLPIQPVSEPPHPVRAEALMAPPSKPAAPLRATKPSPKKDQVARLLTETDVYIKYGLKDRALEHLTKVLEFDPSSVEAFAKMKEIYLAAGDPMRAAESIANIIRIHARAGDAEGQDLARGELLTLMPGHPAGLPGAFAGGGEDVHTQMPGELDDPALDSIDIDISGDVSGSYSRDELHLHEALAEVATEDDEDSQALDSAAFDRMPAVHLAADAGQELEIASESSRPEFDTSFIGDSDIVFSEPVGVIPSQAVAPVAPIASEVTSLGGNDTGPLFDLDDDFASKMEGPEDPSVYSRETWDFGDEDSPNEELGETGLELAGATADIEGAGVMLEALSDAPPFDTPAPFEPEDIARHVLSEVSAALGQVDQAQPALLGDSGLMPDDERVERSIPEVTGSQLVEVLPSSEEDDFLSALNDDAPPGAGRSAPIVADLVTGTPTPTSGLPIHPNAALGGSTGDLLGDEAPLGDALSALDEDDQEDPELESELDSADFFVQQQLYDDAREAILEVLKRRPLYPRAISMLDGVEIAMGLRGEPAPGALLSEPATGAEMIEAETDRMLSSPDIHLQVPSPSAAAEFPSPVLMAPPTAVTPGTEDSHFDLGLAYKEMGLIDEALGEFEKATQSPTHALNALVMIGHCLRSRNDPIAAVGYFHQAFEQTQDPTASLELKYEIASACEAAGELGKALEWYQAACGDDPAYRDAAERANGIAASMGISLGYDNGAQNGGFGAGGYGLDGGQPLGIGGAQRMVESKPVDAPKKNKITYL